MEEFDPIDIEFLINSDEVKKDSASVRADLKSIGATADETTTKVNQQLAQLTSVQSKQAKVLAEQAKADAIWRETVKKNREAREARLGVSGAFGDLEGEQRKVKELAEDVGKLGTKTEDLGESQKKASTSTKSATGSLVGWGAALTAGVGLLLRYAPAIVEFTKNFLGIKEATEEQILAQENLKKALDSTDYSKAVTQITALRENLELAKAGTIDKSVVLEEYNKIIGETAGRATNLLDVEEGLAKNTDNYIEFIFKRAAANLALKDSVDKAIEAEKRRDDLQLEDFKLSDILKFGAGPALPASGLITSLLGSDIDIKEAKKRAAKAADVLKKESDSLLEIYKKIIKEAQEAGKLLGLEVFTPKKTDFAKIVEERKKLLEQLAALDQEYSRKQLDTDAAELQALRDKFGKVRKLVEEFNAKPANAKLQIDTTELDQLQASAEEDLAFKQQTRALAEELKEQKKIFEDYEEAKKQFGIAKAREMYADQLGEFDSYAALLKQKAADNAVSFTAVAEGNNTGGQAERVRLIDGAIDEEKRKEARKYNELLASLMSYEQKRSKIISDYQEKRRILLEQGNVGEANQLKQNVEKELGDLDEAYAKGTDEYKALLRGVENLSDTAARTVIANARKMVQALVDAGKLTNDSVLEINAKIDKLEQTVNQSSSDKAQLVANQINDIANSLINLGNSLQEYNQGLADTITTVGELGQVAGDAATSIALFAAGGNVAGGIAAAISAIAGLFRIGAASRESARQAQAELLKLQQAVADGEIRLNEIQRARNISKAEEIELTLEGIRAQREALKLAEQQLNADALRVQRQLEAEQFVNSSRTEKYGGFLGIGRKTRVVNEYADLLGLTFQEIEKLFEQGRLTDRANELFEQLRRLRDEGADISGLLDNLNDQASQVFTGTTSTAIADSIIEGLKQGYDSFADFAGDIESLLQQSILNAIRFNTLEEPIQRLYEEFAAYAESEGELSQAEADAIRARYQEQVQKAIDQYNQLSGILNEDLLNTPTQQQGLAGAIRRELTEQTGSELTGLFRGQFDVTKRHLELSQKHFEIEQRHLDGTMKLIQSSALIEANTANTVLELQLAVAELRNINKNTKPQQTGRDLGLTG